MNKFKRNKIHKLIAELRKILRGLEDIKLKEENDFDNMPENLQNSPNGEKSEEAIEILEENIEKLEEIITELEMI